MTTTPVPRGRRKNVRFAYQTAFGTAAATGFKQVAVYTDRWTPRSEPQDDDIQGGGALFHNTQGSRPAAPDLEAADGQITWPLDLGVIGEVFKQLLGVSATTGSGPFVNVFTEAAETRPTITVERELGASLFDGAIGAVARQAVFPIGAAAGYRQVAVDYAVREARSNYPTSIAGTPSNLSLGRRVPGSGGTINLNGAAAGRILSGSLTLMNRVEMDRYEGDRFMSEAFVTGFEASVDLTARFANNSLRAFGDIPVGGFLPPAYAVEQSYSLNAGAETLLIELPAVRFAKTAPEFSSGGYTTISLRGRAELSAAAPACRVTLTCPTSYAT